MSSGSTYRRLLAYLRPYVWPRFVVGGICMLIYSGTNGFLPFLIRDVFDDIFAAHDWVKLTWLPLLAVGIFAVRGVSSYGYTYLVEWVGQRIVTDLRDELNRRVQYLPLSFFNRTPSGSIVSRATNDVGQVSNALTQATISLLRDSTTLVALVVAAFVLDWVLALIAFVAFPLTVVPVLNLSKRLRKHSRLGQETLGNLAALLQESVQGNRVVKAFGMEEYERGRFEAESYSLFRYAMKATRARAYIQPIMEMLGALSVAGVIWYGGYSVLSGSRTQGAFLGFMAALILVYDPFKGLARANAEVQRGLASADRIFEVLDEPAEVADAPDATVLSPLRDEIRFDGVRFRYAPRVRTGGGPAAVEEEALRGIDLCLKRGQAVALVGPSGGGKSTLGDLIPRFYDPTAGAVTIDGVDIRGVTLESLRAQIGIVTQFTFLFNDTIRANIAYGRSGTTQEAIESAARAAYAHEFIQQLPDGYDTVVGELGVTLSGGQRQRIAIARALLKNAPILILDEATSALDSESERAVQSAIERLMEGRTTLVIAHRLATIQRCDRIAVMAGGRIVEQGTHEELLASGALYRRLHDQQALGGPAEAPEREEPACA